MPFLIDTLHGWPLLTTVMVVGLFVAVVLLMGMGTIFAILGNKQAHAEYDRQYQTNLDWLQQRGQPTDIEVVAELRQFASEAELKRKYFN